MSKFEDVKNSVSEYMSKRKKRSATSKLLQEYQHEFYLAQSKYINIGTFDDREKLYIGTHGTDENVNDDRVAPNGRTRANNVVNIIYELVESQVDTQIPQPSVRSKWPGKEYLEKMVEDSIKNDLAESEIYRINDENERITPVQGFSFVTVEWNPDFDRHLYRGEIQLDNIHPKCFIPQPGQYRLQDMAYFFLITSAPSEYVKRRYGVDVSNQGEEFPQYNQIDGISDNHNDPNNLTIITRWGKDENNVISKFVWTNDTVLEHYEDYYARYVTRCSYCYTPTFEEDVTNGEAPCPTCAQYGREEYKRVTKKEDTEALFQDYTKQDGTVIPAGTEIPYFKPTRYPIIMRKNVPLPFNFGGQSDIDIVRDQADAIKKVVSTMEEKILRGGVVLKAANNHKFNLKNQLYQVVRGEPNELASLQSMDIQGNIQQDFQFFQGQYKAAKDTLGITDSFQGKPDASAKSGVAKQIQVFQSSGRMMSKQFNKKIAYKELFEIMFEFKLAFYDEIRPYIQLDVSGEPVYGAFNKYEFLEQDASGEWYYNTDFLFSAEAGDGIPKDKMWLMNQTLMYTQSGLMDKVQFWSALEKLGYPGASDYKTAAIEEKRMMMQQQQAMAQQQQEMMQSQAMQQQDETNYQRRLDAAKMAQENIKINSKGGGAK